MIKAAVIGHPIAHSKSPRIHNHWIHRHGIDGHYGSFDVMTQDLGDFIKARQQESYAGFNVTLPHKIAVMEYCGSLTNDARAVGAVNMVTLHQSGMVEGHNTDAYGFLQNLIKNAGEGWAEKPALVLGAGGASRAVVHALSQSGAPEIRLTNRTIEKAEDMAETFRVTIHDWDQKARAMDDCGLVINTTSLGMTGQPPLDLDIASAPGDCIFYDLVYAPLQTPFLQKAALKGHKTVTGIGMLLHQARPAFHKWFGVDPVIDNDLQAVVLS